MDRYYKWCAQTQDELPPQRVWREYVFKGCSIDHDRLDGIAEELMLYFETRFFHREMRPEMPAVLKTIRDMGLKIGLISNIISLGSVPSALKNMVSESISIPSCCPASMGAASLTRPSSITPRVLPTFLPAHASMSETAYREMCLVQSGQVTVYLS